MPLSAHNPNRVTGVFRWAFLSCAFVTVVSSPAFAEQEKPIGFGAEPTQAKPQGFGKESGGVSARGDRAEANLKYARGLMEKYDKSGDGVLQREEWSEISGRPERADANRDGKITLDELFARASLRDSARRSSKGTPEKNDDTAGERVSYRLTAPHDRLPPGLPSWFASRDKNQDGQVAMHEYSGTWNKSTVRRFVKIDSNGDGFLSPTEAIENR